MSTHGEDDTKSAQEAVYRQLEIWPETRVPQRILFHRDFDGICSAALLLHHFARQVELEPVDYGIRDSWLSRNLEHCAVVDFLYHPRALWWFDHHETTFLVEQHRKLYNMDPRHRWDTSYKSCPPLILDVLTESVNTSDYHRLFGEWVRWSDTIDSAEYSSPLQATLGQEPCLLVNQAVVHSSDPAFLTGVVQAIARGAGPSTVAGDPEVKSKWTAYRESVEQSLALLGKRMQVSRGVALCNLTSTQAKFLRYGAYCIDPSIEFSITVYNSGRGARPFKLSLSHNPWLDTPPHTNLGLLARQFGGGGHEKVASVSTKSAQMAIDIAGIVASKLQNGGEKDGSSQQGT